MKLFITSLSILLVSGCSVTNNFCKDPEGNILLNNLASANPMVYKTSIGIICTTYAIIKDSNKTN